MDPGEVASFGIRLTVYHSGREADYLIPEIPPAQAVIPLRALAAMLEGYGNEAKAQFFSNTVYGAGSVSFRNQRKPAPAEDVVEALKRFVAELEGKEQ